MNNNTKRIIFLVVMLQLLLAVGLLALPPVVRALPGAYYVRLQNHPLTAGVMDLITTPIPSALPAPVATTEGLDSAEPAGGAVEIAIPGLEQSDMPTTPTALPSPTPAGEATIMPSAGATIAPALPTSTPPPTPTLAPPPPVHQLEGLETVVQGFNNCGPANLSIVLNYWGDETTQEDAAAVLKPNREDRNVSPWQITNYVNESTALRSTAHSGGNMTMLKQLVAAGIPVVVEKGYEPNESEGWYGHYLTVYGYDDTKQEIYSRDTDAGPFDGSPRIDPYDEFEYWWQQFNYTFYVVYTPAQANLVFSIIPQVLQNEADMWNYTAEIARQEMAADPENVFAIFNLGVSMTRLGQLTGDTAYYQSGADAFDQAREIGLPPRTLYYEHRPFMAYWKTGRFTDVLTLVEAMLATPGGRYVEEIFWYQGHALVSEGDYTGARTAYENALDVNPNFEQAQQSLDWLNATFFSG
jgi:hypothetical protein